MSTPSLRTVGRILDAFGLTVAELGEAIDAVGEDRDVMHAIEQRRARLSSQTAEALASHGEPKVGAAPPPVVEGQDGRRYQLVPLPAQPPPSRELGPESLEILARLEEMIEETVRRIHPPSDSASASRERDLG